MGVAVKLGKAVVWGVVDGRSVGVVVGLLLCVAVSVETGVTLVVAVIVGDTVVVRVGEGDGKGMSIGVMV